VVGSRPVAGSRPAVGSRPVVAAAGIHRMAVADCSPAVGAVDRTL